MLDSEEVTWFAAVTTYFNYFLLFLCGYIREIGVVFRQFFKPSATPKGYAPLVKGFEDFYTRRFYGRINDCWNRPTTGRPGSRINVAIRERVNKSLVKTGEYRDCVNLGSYNYLGFADENERCRKDVLDSLSRLGVTTASADFGCGHSTLHEELEKEFASFIGKPAAMLISMGFATNSTVLPALVQKGDLVVSDALNHASIITGARSSGAKVKVFRHNSAQSLEKCLRDAVRSGQPRTGLPWKKILVVVEGIYSMEGECCNLKEIIEVTRKHKAYLWLDEAHSIGCMGSTGRGMCEHSGVNPDNVDVLMGTFTKSFGSFGGYIAGSQELIDYLKSVTAPNIHGATLSPGCVQQTLTALRIISGADGTNLGKQKLSQLRENSNMFRQRMTNMGCHVLGDEDSPVIPVLVYNPTKLAFFSRECLRRGIAVVVVGFPATPLLLGRVRFCISAGHTMEDLNKCLDDLEDVVDACLLKYEHEPWEKMFIAFGKMMEKGQDKLESLVGRKQKVM